MTVDKPSRVCELFAMAGKFLERPGRIVAGGVSKQRKGQRTIGFAGLFAGRSERIRTSGPCLPKAVLYQAELHSVCAGGTYNA